MARIKDIAELAGVSRGTVDRVLNNRSGVSPQTAEKIKEIAKALDYRPNKAGLALAAQKKKNKIGIVLFSRNNPFFDEVSEGVQAKAQELADYGVTTLTRRVEFDLAAQLAAIDELLDEGIHGLLLAPYNHPAIQEKIDKSPDPDDINSIITSDEKRRLKIGEPMLVNVDNVKPLSIAVEEVNEGLVKILPADKTADEE